MRAADLALWGASMADFLALDEGTTGRRRRMALRRWALVRLRSRVARSTALTGLLERTRDAVTVLLR